MVSILNSFEERLSKLEATILPVYQETDNLRRRQENIDRTLEALDHVIGFYNVSKGIVFQPLTFFQLIKSNLSGIIKCYCFISELFLMTFELPLLYTPLTQDYQIFLNSMSGLCNNKENRGKSLQYHESFLNFCRS
jgi:hypothetical protein